MSLFKLNLESLGAFIFVQKSILDKSFVDFGIVLVRLKLRMHTSTRGDCSLFDRENYLYQNCFELSSYVWLKGERSYIRLSGFVQCQGYNWLQDRKENSRSVLWNLLVVNLNHLVHLHFLKQSEKFWWVWIVLHRFLHEIKLNKLHYSFIWESSIQSKLPWAVCQRLTLSCRRATF